MTHIVNLPSLYVRVSSQSVLKLMENPPNPHFGYSNSTKASKMCRAHKRDQIMAALPL